MKNTWSIFHFVFVLWISNDFHHLLFCLVVLDILIIALTSSFFFPCFHVLWSLKSWWFFNSENHRNTKMWKYKWFPPPPPLGCPRCIDYWTDALTQNITLCLKYVLHQTSIDYLQLLDQTYFYSHISYYYICVSVSVHLIL